MGDGKGAQTLEAMAYFGFATPAAFFGFLPEPTIAITRISTGASSASKAVVPTADHAG